MKKKDFLYLQLFADDPGNGDEGAPEPEDKPGSAGGSEPHEDAPEPEKKYTDDDLDEIIKRKKAEWEKTRQKEDDEAKKLAKMNAQEKSEYKQQQLEKRIQELEDEKTLSDMRDEARKQLSDKGINISDELLAFMVSKDAKETKEAVDSFANLFNAAVNEAVKGKARQTTPKESGHFSSGKAGINIGEMAKKARIIK